MDAGGRARDRRTNKVLEHEIERGNFREDLFYRLNVIPFHVPPCVTAWKTSAAGGLFSARVHAGVRPQAQGLTPAAYEVLQEHHWPATCASCAT